MNKQTTAVVTMVAVILAVISAGLFLSGAMVKDKNYDRMVNEQREQLRFEGFDPDRGVVKVRIVE